MPISCCVMFELSHTISILGGAMILVIMEACTVLSLLHGIAAGAALPLGAVLNKKHRSKLQKAISRAPKYRINIRILKNIISGIPSYWALELECEILMVILYYTILYYTILYYTILCYTILYYTILYYTILYYTILYYSIPYYLILYYTISYRLYPPKGHLLMALL